MDREAAKEALGVFMKGKTLRANQIEFLDLIVDHLTENGTLEAARLYESPYTDVNALGVEGVFASAEVAELMAVRDDAQVWSNRGPGSRLRPEVVPRRGRERHG